MFGFGAQELLVVRPFLVFAIAWFVLWPIWVASVFKSKRMAPALGALVGFVLGPIGLIIALLFPPATPAV
ncbi:hypothetical protein BH11ARM1_BH11ARM1_10950 [soil metagenome]